MIAETIRARQIFQELAQLDDEFFPLDQMALALPMEEYPELDPTKYLRVLDSLASTTNTLIGEDREPGNVIECLNQVLFVQEGIRGNVEDYYDPRNSFLNEVLDRKLGIPISISVIYMEVARRIRFSLDGIGFPGHFIVKHRHDRREILVDPFNHGKTLTEKDCQELLDRVYGGAVEVKSNFLQPLDKKAIVTRMLFNLKGIYYQGEQYQKALSVIDRILLINPGILSEIRDRGLLYMQTSLFSKALADLEQYLREAQFPEDKLSVEGHIKTLRGIVTSAN